MDAIFRAVSASMNYRAAYKVNGGYVMLFDGHPVGHQESPDANEWRMGVWAIDIDGTVMRRSVTGVWVLVSKQT